MKDQVVNQLGRTPRLDIHNAARERNIGDRNEYAASPQTAHPIEMVQPGTATTTITATTNAKKQRRRNRKRNKNRTTTLPRSTFGVGERFDPIDRSYRSIVAGRQTTPVDRIKQHTAQNIPCRPSSQFKSTSPRFSRHPTIHPTILPQEKQVQRIERKIQKYKDTSSVAEAYLQVLEASLSGFKHIDTDHEQLEQDKLTATSLTHNQRSCGRGTTGKIRPLSARVFRRTKQQQPTSTFTSFGMGKQRTNQLYNTATMPNAWIQPTPTGDLMITSIQVKRPNVHSSASKSPRLNSSARRPFTTPLHVQARPSGGGDTCTEAEKESIVGVPTVIRLCLRDVYPSLNKQKNVWRQQELKERLHNTNNGPPPPRTPATCSTGTCASTCTSINLLRNNTCKSTNNGIQNLNATAAAATAGKRRPKSAGATKPRRRRKKIIRPRSAATERRILARTRAKMKQMKKRLYNHDNWMQEYVIPR